jgi:ribosomal protein L11 methyltransferase
VAKGLIEYSYVFGQSYLVMSLRRPLEIGTRFTLLPHDYSGPPVQPRLPLSIASGSAFGCGRHPTTRLALLALERGWSLDRSSTGSASPAVVDIGTGSGILAIAAARLGASTVTAIDIDACARVEAQDNIARNKGIAPIIVSDTPLQNLNGSFDIVIANLRLPTLMRLLGWLPNHLSPEGWVVVSGVRQSEWPRLETAYGDEGLQAVWRQSEAGWAGGLFRQKVG